MDHWYALLREIYRRTWPFWFRLLGKRLFWGLFAGSAVLAVILNYTT